MRSVAMLLVALLLSSCVISKEPVGEGVPPVITPFFDNADWTDGNGSTFKTRVISADDGVIELYDLVLPKYRAPSVVRVSLRKAYEPYSTYLIANARDPLVSDAETYFVGLIDVGPNYLLVYPIDSSQVSMQSKNGLIDYNDISNQTKPSERYAHLSDVSTLYVIDRVSAKRMSVSGKTVCELGYIAEAITGQCRPMRTLFADHPKYVFVRNRAPAR